MPQGPFHGSPSCQGIAFGPMRGSAGDAGETWKAFLSAGIWASQKIPGAWETRPPCTLGAEKRSSACSLPCCYLPTVGPLCFSDQVIMGPLDQSGSDFECYLKRLMGNRNQSCQMCVDSVEHCCVNMGKSPCDTNICMTTHIPAHPQMNAGPLKRHTFHMRKVHICVYMHMKLQRLIFQNV